MSLHKVFTINKPEVVFENDIGNPDNFIKHLNKYLFFCRHKNIKLKLTLTIRRQIKKTKQNTEYSACERKSSIFIAFVTELHLNVPKDITH